MAQSVISDSEYCYVCGSPYTQEHHIFFGVSNRKISDRMGYVIRLCAEHHTGSTGVHRNREFDLHLKRLGQKHFEENHGTRDDFIRTFGRSYL